VLKAVGLLIDNAYFYAALIVALVLLGENRNDRRLRILATLVVVIVLGAAIKETLAHPRPCAGVSGCPADYSFPSLHASAAFALMIAFLNRKAYPLYLLFALFISFTRLNTGVHVFADIAGGLAVALVGYYAVDLVWRSGGRDVHGA